MRDWKRYVIQSAALVSKKWKQARFVAGAAAGVLVSRLSSHRSAARVLSFLGIILRKKRVHGTSVEVAGIDDRRRAFLKYAALGGAVFFAGKYVTPLVNLLRGDTVLSEKTFQNFTVTETGKELRVTDDEGGELLVIEKEGF